MKRLDGWISDKKQQQDFQSKGQLDRQFGIQPWTARSYVFCLRLAFAYPIFMIMLFWLFGFTSIGQLKDFVFFPETSFSIRFGLLASLIFSRFSFYQGKYHTGWYRWVWYLLGMSAIISTVAFGVAAAGGFTGIAFTVAGAGIFGVALAFIVTSTGSDSIAFSSASATFVAIAIVTAVFFGAAIGTGVVVGFFIVVSVFIAGLVNYCLGQSIRNKLQLFVWFSYTGILLICITLILSNLSLSDNAITYLIFLGLLPLLNATWDWCSLGLTRGLLTSIRLGKHPGLKALGWGLADLGFALFFLTGIIATVTAALAFSNQLIINNGGTAWFDLIGLISDIRESPDDPRHFWLYTMFFSTLIPTLLHALAAAASVIQVVHTSAFRRWRHQAADPLAKNRSLHSKVQLYFTAIPIVATLAPLGLLFLLYVSLAAWGGLGGGLLLDLAESIALSIG